MSITNFINSETGTIVQGVNGIRLCRESWMTERAMKRAALCKTGTQPIKDVLQESECVTDKDIALRI